MSSRNYEYVFLLYMFLQQAVLYVVAQPGQAVV